jgi:hypothetical protein
MLQIILIYISMKFIARFLVIGDCNAKIGPQDSQYTFHSETNINGQHLLDLTQETNRVITNTCFQKEPGKLWTYISDMNRHTKT